MDRNISIYCDADNETSDFSDETPDYQETNKGDYYMDVREFKGGAVEVLLKTIRPMHEGAVRSVADPLSYANCCHEMGESSSVYSGSRYVTEKEETDDYDRTANHHRAVRRAKQNIRWLIAQMGGDRLLTLTYRTNMEDRERVKTDFTKFVRLVRKGWKGQGGYPEWRYVAVTERQERGAYHIHIAVQGWQKISFLRACWYRALGGQGNEKGERTPGNVDITSPKKARWGTEFREWKTSKLSAYLTKYLAKTFDQESTEKKRYWHSVDVVPPKKERHILGATDLVTAIKEAIEVLYFHYGKTIDFARSWLAPSKDCLWLSLGGT